MLLTFSQRVNDLLVSWGNGVFADAIDEYVSDRFGGIKCGTGYDLNPVALDVPEATSEIAYFLEAMFQLPIDDADVSLSNNFPKTFLN